MSNVEEDAATKHANVKRSGRISVAADSDFAKAVVRDTHELLLDEPERDWMPYGDDAAPSPGDYLCVGIAGCQLEVLRQCFEKARIDDYEIEIEYNRISVDSGEDVAPMPAHTASRIGTLELEMTVKTTSEYEDRVKRCLEVCEDGCIMSRSVEAGIDVPLEKSLVVED